VIYLIIAKVKASAITSVAAKSATSSSKVSGSGATKTPIVNSESVRLKPENKEPEVKENLKVVEEVENLN
jgi:hypothetical protein